MNTGIYRVLAFILLCILSACEKDSGSTERSDSSFVLSQRILSVGAEGGDFSVSYSIDGPMEGNKAEIATEESWIHIGKVYNSEFNFTVDSNNDGSDRTGAIVLSCQGTTPYTLHVTQSKEATGSQIYHRFAIDVKDITTSSALITITPVDPAMKYLYTVVSKSDYEAYGAERYIETRVGQVLETSAIYGVDPSSFLSSGVLENNNTSLADDTAYYVAVFDLSFSQDGKPSYSGEIELREFRTAKASSVDMSFKLSVTGTRLGVTPTGNDTYICDVTTKEIWDSYDSPEAVARDYVATMKAYGYLEAFLYRGSTNMDYSETITVRGDTYVAYAVGYRLASDDGGLTTDVEYMTFVY